MKIAVIGSRKVTDKEWVYDQLDKHIGHVPDRGVVIISGGAKGVDTLAAQYARDCNYDFVLFKPYHLIDNQMEYNPRFFFTRNKQIADNADEVVAFWDGQSSGTRHMIEYCQRHNKKVRVIEVNDERSNRTRG